jgi:hypothetical protein
MPDYIFLSGHQLEKNNGHADACLHQAVDMLMTTF